MFAKSQDAPAGGPIGAATSVALIEIIRPLARAETPCGFSPLAPLAVQARGLNGKIPGIPFGGAKDARRSKSFGLSPASGLPGLRPIGRCGQTSGRWASDVRAGTPAGHWRSIPDRRRTGPHGLHAP